MVETKAGKPTVSMVARHAGVSPTTVSFVVNDVRRGSVGEITRQRVLASINELGYRPNHTARALSTSRTNAIAFVTDDIASSPYAGKLIMGAQECAWESGKILFVVNTTRDRNIINAAVEMALDYPVEAFVYATRTAREAHPPSTLYENATILLNCDVADKSLRSIMPDDIGGGRMAVDFLISSGHRRIGFIAGGESIYAGRDRMFGYCNALSGAGIAYDDTLVRHSDWSAEQGYKLTHELLAENDPPTSLFCINDTVALGCYEAIKETKLQIGRDISVIGFDDQEMSAMLRPKLTTVALPLYEMGRRAVRQLLETPGAKGSTTQDKISCRLIERQSHARLYP